MKEIREIWIWKISWCCRICFKHPTICIMKHSLLSFRKQGFEFCNEIFIFWTFWLKFWVTYVVFLQELNYWALNQLEKVLRFRFISFNRKSLVSAKSLYSKQNIKRSPGMIDKDPHSITWLRLFYKFFFWKLVVFSEKVQQIAFDLNFVISN